MNESSKRRLMIDHFNEDNDVNFLNVMTQPFSDLVHSCIKKGVEGDFALPSIISPNTLYDMTSLFVEAVVTVVSMTGKSFTQVAQKVENQPPKAKSLTTAKNQKIINQMNLVGGAHLFPTTSQEVDQEIEKLKRDFEISRAKYLKIQKDLFTAKDEFAKADEASWKWIDRLYQARVGNLLTKIKSMPEKFKKATRELRVEDDLLHNIDNRNEAIHFVDEVTEMIRDMALETLEGSNPLAVRCGEINKQTNAALKRFQDAEKLELTARRELIAKSEILQALNNKSSKNGSLDFTIPTSSPVVNLASIPQDDDYFSSSQHRKASEEEENLPLPESSHVIDLSSLRPEKPSHEGVIFASSIGDFRKKIDHVLDEDDDSEAHRLLTSSISSLLQDPSHQ